MRFQLFEHLADRARRNPQLFGGMLDGKMSAVASKGAQRACSGGSRFPFIQFF
jgi:hypothetical protein